MNFFDDEFEFRHSLPEYTLFTEEHGIKLIEITFNDIRNINITGKNEYEIYNSLMSVVNWYRVDAYIDSKVCKIENPALLANKLRERGNLSYIQKDFHTSMLLYNRSLSVSQYKSRSYALALSNRSAVLFHLRKYEDCLKNIELCLQSNYPNDMKPKLFIRKIQCYQNLGLRTEAETAFNEINNFLKTNKVTIEESSKYLKLATRLRNEFRKTQTNVNGTEKTFELPQIKEKNNVLPGASSSVYLQENANGSKIIAKNNIKKGDVLFVEKPAIVSNVFKLPVGNCYRMCLHCGTFVISWIPCRKCPAAIYCSEKCRNNDWNDRHRWKCVNHMYPEFWMDFKYGNLAFDMLLKNINTNFSCNVFIDESALMNRLKDMQFTLLQFAAACIIITRFLERKTTFFKFLRETKKMFLKLESSNVIIKVGSLLLKYYAIVLFKSVDINHPGFHITPNGEEQEDFLEWFTHAAGIYTSSANVNHSCAPNTSYHFVGSTIIIKAAEDITTEEEIFCSWYTKYNIIRKQARTLMLKAKYNFKCECRGCTDTKYELYASKEIVACLKCKAPNVVKPFETEVFGVYTCVKCNFQFSFNEIFFKMQTLYNSDLLVELKSLSELLKEEKLIKDFFSEYHPRYIIITIAIFKEYLMRKNLQKAFMYSKKFLNVLKYSFTDGEYLDQLMNCCSSIYKSVTGPGIFEVNRSDLIQWNEIMTETKILSNLLYSRNSKLKVLEVLFEQILTIHRVAGNF